jgi:hypothetical protein
LGSLQKTAVGATDDHEFFRKRIILCNEVLGGDDEVIEHILFFRQITLPMPGLAELTAATQVGIATIPTRIAWIRETLRRLIRKASEVLNSDNSV